MGLGLGGEGFGLPAGDEKLEDFDEEELGEVVVLDVDEFVDLSCKLEALSVVGSR